MYTPKVYTADPAFAHRLIHDYPFGLLVSAASRSGLVGSHLPFMIDPQRGAHGTLVAHLAKANPQCRDLEGAPVMVAFSGPDAYVSPSWYEDQETVPTWNYAAVHAYGVARLVRGTGELLAMVERLTREHEARAGSSWTLAQAAPILDAELRGIVGLEIAIERLETKAKLNQNRTIADREGVAAALARSDDSRARAVAALMRDQLARSVTADVFRRAL